ncbi:MAG: hypothetical protein K2M95_05230 [Clostridiales bacterium]|nr:hypothetical protein [Clostridiales bacterium]
MVINVTGATLSEEEKNSYVKYVSDKYPEKQLNELDIHVDGEFVDLKYHFAPVRFERIRRITGYLVGTLDRFNNAKAAEEHDRIKHNLA